MRRKMMALLCIGCFMAVNPGCGSQANEGEVGIETETGIEAQAETETKVRDEQINISLEEFCDMALNDYGLEASEEELQEIYQMMKKSEILQKESMQLTGMVLNDYDQNGKKDMIVCVCNQWWGGSNSGNSLYLLMNGEKLYYMQDPLCDYEAGDIYDDFGADVDHDQINEVVFCVKGKEEAPAKFVIKPMENEIVRMDLHHGLFSDEDYGEMPFVYEGMEEGVCEVSFWKLGQKAAMKVREKTDWSEDDYEYGYHTMGMTEYQGEALLAGYEYIYLDGTIVGNAVFVQDWDENGEAYVKGWYLEDNEGKKYMPYESLKKSSFDYSNLFEKNETGEEVRAYEDFMTGKKRAHMDADICNDSIGARTADEPEVMDKDGKGFSFEELIDRIIRDSIEMEDGLSQEGEGGIWDVQYALIDCGNDGKKQLALRAYGFGIEGKCDDSTCTMVFDYKNGEIFMVYIDDSWSRSRTTLYKNGYVYGHGSGGAAVGYTWERCIGADGVCRKSFDCYTQYDREVSGTEMSSWTKWNGRNGTTDWVYFSEYTINGEKVYSYHVDEDTTDENKQDIRDYIKYNEELMGVHFLTSNELDALLAKIRESIGITKGMDGEKNEIEWKLLHVNGRTYY